MNVVQFYSILPVHYNLTNALNQLSFSYTWIIGSSSKQNVWSEIRI